MPGSAPATTTLEKALQMNLDRTKYGTFAEIGAGQEVANWFFRASASAGTVAKTISAYDMTMSDALYGGGVRYVSRPRLEAMLDHEYGILLERLTEGRGEDSTFFSFANTVRARGYKDTEECHGWMGIRFQHEPGAEPSEVLVHVRLLDETNEEQMEALGILGVNLVHGVFFNNESSSSMAACLIDNLNRWRVEIDMLKAMGPAFPEHDNRLSALHLVELGLADAALFTPEGEVLQPAEALYKKAIFLTRGSFNPVTLVDLDMIDAGVKQFLEEHPEVAEGKGHLEIVELTMHNLLQSEGAVDYSDFLARADVLQELGKTVMISRYAEFYRLSPFFSRYTQEPMGIVLGVPLLEELFQERWYENLPGGILESFGRLFKHDIHIYGYPAVDRKAKTIKRTADAEVAPHLQHLFSHLTENSFIRSIPDCLEDCALHSSNDIRQMIADGDDTWRSLVPEVVLQSERWGKGGG